MRAGKTGDNRDESVSSDYEYIAAKVMNDRGSIAIWIACAMPVFMLSIALPVEYGQWQTVTVHTQTTADLSALAGMDEYRVSLNDHLTVATAKANAIETATLLAKAHGHTATAELVSGVFDPTSQGLRVTINESVPLLMLARLGTATAFNVTVTATTELLKATGASYTGDDATTVALWQHCDLSTLPVTCVANVTR